MAEHILDGASSLARVEKRMECGVEHRKRVEAALDAGRLEIAMRTGKWWKARRNGKTQLKIILPNDYSIPIKFGLKSCARLTPNWVEGVHYRIVEKTND